MRSLSHRTSRFLARAETKYQPFGKRDTELLECLNEFLREARHGLPAFDGYYMILYRLEAITSRLEAKGPCFIDTPSCR